MQTDHDHQTTNDQTVSIYALMAVRAGRRSVHGGAWRLWAWARELDHQGSGAVLRGDLEAYTGRLGVPASTFRRWLSQARRLGYFQQKRRWYGDYVLILTGIERTCRLLGMVTGSDLDPRPVTIPAAALAGDDWRAWVWAAFVANLQEQPMSRATMRKVTGVPERTQREYECIAGVTCTPTYAHDDTRGADHLAGVREFERERAFTWFDRSQSKFVLAWRLPDIRTAPGAVTRDRKGRTGKIKRALNMSLCSLGGLAKKRPVRIFHEDYKHARAAARAYAKMDILPDEPDAIREFYYKKPGGRGVHQFATLPAGLPV